jgi:anti-sigma factor RsiW
MCPEPLTLSAFFDGELPQPESIEVAAHVAACSSCRSKVDRFSYLSRSLAAVPSVESGETAKRSKLHISSRASLSAPSFRWGRAIVIPAPVVAFAAVLIVALSVGLALSGRRGTGPVGEVAKLSNSTFDDIITYLESRQNAEPVTFQLPAFAQVHVEGDPVLVRAADYHRALQ